MLSQRVVEREKQAVIEARRDMVRDRFPVPGVWDAVDSEDGNGGGGSRVIEGECALSGSYLQLECVDSY